MTLHYNADFIYATAKVSSRHVINMEFVRSLALNKKIDYVYPGANNSIIVNLGSISDSWRVINETLAGDGWQSVDGSVLLPIFQALVEAGTLCVDLNDDNPFVRWATWFTTALSFKPLGYGLSLYTYDALPEEQQKQARRLQKLISPETLAEATFFAVGNGTIFSTDDIEPFKSEEGAKLAAFFDGVIRTSNGIMLLVKRYPETLKVDVAQIL